MRAALHIHNPKELSAVYYVAEGRALPPGAARTDGCLLFRGGPSLRPDGQATKAHSFMRVEPTAGTLWIFPGGVPHTVMGMESAAPAEMRGDDGCSHRGMEPRLHLEQPSSAAAMDATTTAELQAQREVTRARISIAINFFVAVPNTPQTVASVALVY